MSGAGRALISVYDKKNIAEFARSLSELGFVIVSSGGTARLLASSGIKVTEVSDFTGFPEMMDGRVKTLNPKIHGGILADRSKKEHLEQAKAQGIGLIDMVVVNLYPFEETIEKSGEDLDKVIENIDIGGPALVRSAAKNYRSVAVLVNPERYAQVASELQKGKLSERMHETLAMEAWEHIAHYDTVIENYFRRRLRGMKYPPYLNLTFRKKQDLRYGENPHQTAGFYIDDHFRQHSITNAKQLQGKELSYNNILDANAALELLKEFEDVPTAVVVKHNNPSGVASNETDILEAFRVARSVDPEAAFGGIFCVNKEVDAPLAKEMLTGFVEVVIAPSFTKEALDDFSKKKNVRLLVVESIERKREPYIEYRSVVGGLLTQDGNILLHDQKFNVVTKRQPTDYEIASMKYAWKVAKYVKSNATIFARPDQVVAIGAGQMKRVDATRLAGMIAKGFNASLQGTAMASDAFFPFRDGVDEAAKLGASAIIQPGGSIRDKEVIAAADEHNLAMVFTGVRHFRH